MNEKNCLICVYHGVCEGRMKDQAILDCCIPEEPLRQRQEKTKTVEEFASVTHEYISAVKAKSKYWIRERIYGYK